MSDYLPFIVIGVATGAIYAIAAMGLVLTYRTSGVFNFAHGAIGMFTTFVFYSLRETYDLPTPLAMFIAVLMLAPALGWFIANVLFRFIGMASPAAHVVATVGLLVALQAAATAIYTGNTRPVAPIFWTNQFKIFGVNVGADRIAVVAIAIVLAVGLTIFFRVSHLGLQTQAVVQDPNLAELTGISSRRITTMSWMIGASLASLSGVIFSPFIQLDAVLLTLLVIQAFGAAVVGLLRSFPLTNLGAYGLGIGAALLTKVVAGRPSLVGIPGSFPFFVLLLMLVAAPGLFRSASRSEGRWSARRSVAGASRGRWWVLGIGLPLGALVPVVFEEGRVLTATTMLAFVLIFASLSLLVGISRQVSLCHAVFVAFGATTVGHLANGGVPYPAALLLSALAMVMVGALIAVPAIRLSGVFLALATLGFGVLAEQFLYVTSFGFGRTQGLTVPRPSWFESHSKYYLFVLAIVGVSLVIIEVVRSGRLGRILRAVADSDRACLSAGLNPTTARVVVFCISAFFAAVGGALLGSQVQSLHPFSFTYQNSLIWVAVLYTAGTLTLSGSVLAAGLLVLVPAVFTAQWVSDWQPVAFGVAAMIFAQSESGIVGAVSQLARRVTAFSGLRQQVARTRDAERRALVLARMQQEVSVAAQH